MFWRLWITMYNLESMEIVAQGAEGKVYSTAFLGRKTIVKQRFKKVRAVSHAILRCV